MVLDYESGKIYDTLMAINFHFSLKTWEEIYKKRGYQNPDLHFEIYDKIKDELDFVSEHLFSLFYYDGEKASPMTDFYVQKFDMKNYGFEDLLRIIEDDSIFKKCFITYIFGENYDITDKRLLHKNIFNICVSDKNKEHRFKYCLLYIIDNFNDVKKELIYAIEKIYPVISKLHDEHKTLINDYLEKLNNKEIIEMNSKLRKFTNEQVENTKVGISLINKYIYIYKADINAVYSVMGIEYLEHLKKQIEIDNVSYEKFFSSISNPIKYGIVRILCEHKELTISNMSELLYTSYSTTNRCVADLFHASIIFISRQKGVKIYYSINKEYLIRLKRSFVEFIDLAIDRI